MNAVIESLLTAAALSGLAALSLALLPQAPPRLRFAIAAAGLVAWFVPWGAIHIVVPAEAVPAAFAAPAAALAEARFDAVTPLAYSLVLATAIGLALLARECLALRRCTRRWRAASRRADGLRALLPPELAAVRAEFRLVADNDVAAASGWLKPTIWIGDRYDGERLRLVVIHEAWHAHSRDPLWIAAIAAARRIYWWNPLVAHLARQAVLMLESTCDHRSAAHFATSRYAAELASLVLARATPGPALLATMRCGNLDVQRLRLLGAPLRVRARDIAIVAALGCSATAAALSNVVEAARTPAQAANAPPAAPAVSAQSGDARFGDELDTYAYAPQQYLGEPDFDSTRGITP